MNYSTRPIRKTRPLAKLSSLLRNFLKKLFNTVNLAVFFYKEDHHYIPNHFCKSSARKMDFIGQGVFRRCAEKVIADNRCSLHYDRLFTFYQLFENLKDLIPPEQQITVMEAGVYQGGSSYFLCSLMEHMLPDHDVELFCVDTFEGHSPLDIKNQKEGRQTPGLFSKTSYESVKTYLSEYDFATVLKGRIQACETQLSNKDFALIHLDMDIYEPTIYALERYSKRLLKNGFFVLDDYKYSSCPGIGKAIDEFLSNRCDFIKIELITGQCILIKRDCP